jgi:hypothetical protein
MTEASLILRGRAAAVIEGTFGIGRSDVLSDPREQEPT